MLIADMTRTSTFQSKANNQIIIEEQSPVDYRIKMTYLSAIIIERVNVYFSTYIVWGSTVFWGTNCFLANPPSIVQTKEFPSQNIFLFKSLNTANFTAVSVMCACAVVHCI